MVDYQWAGKEIGNPNPNPRFARSMCQNSEITCCHYVKKVHILLGKALLLVDNMYQ